MQDALTFVATRARLMATKCHPGTSGMVSCRAPVAEVSNVLSENAPEMPGLSIACYNSPEDIVVAGPSKSLEQFAEYCKDKGIKQKRLPVPFGFHSSAMDSIVDDLKACASSLDFRPPQIKIGSSLCGRILQLDETFEEDYLAKHTRESVKFSDLVKSFSAELSGSDVQILEVGPAATSKSRPLRQETPFAPLLPLAQFYSIALLV